MGLLKIHMHYFNTKVNLDNTKQYFYRKIPLKEITLNQNDPTV